MVYAQVGRFALNISFFCPFLQVFFHESKKTVMAFSWFSQKTTKTIQKRRSVPIFLQKGVFFAVI